MSNTKNKTKNILCSIILCFAMILSAFVGIKLAPKTEVNANTLIAEDVSSNLLSTYYNFATSSSAKPATPNGWSEIKDNQVNSESGRMVRGIVDVTDETTFSTSTYKTTRPRMLLEEKQEKDYFKNLMINSYKDAGRFGYKSNSISLDANSFYGISVTLYTHRTQKTDDFEETDPTASIYLTGLTEDEKYESSVKFENINTLTTWATYTFYIDTDSNSKSVNLELWLGSKNTSVQGAVFFNNVKIIRYSEDYYYEKILVNEDTETNNFNIISLSKDNPYTRPVTNSSFESSSPLGWDVIAKSTSSFNQRCEVVDVNNFRLTLENEKEIKAPGSNNSPDNLYSLFMYNKEDGYQAIESSKINIEELGYYRISFWAKSDCGTGNGATVLLVDKSEENAIDSATLTLATTYTKDKNKYNNDWTKYSFYVYGSEDGDKEVTIQIWLGTNASKTSGYVFIDDFRMEKISYQTYSSNSTSTNSKALNFNSSSDSFVITNSNFNKTSNADVNRTYPLVPSNWTKEGNTNNNTFSGVISAKKEHFEENVDKYTNSSILPIRPTGHPIYGDNNNVLMIGSTSENNTQSYKSENISLSANSYYKLSYYVLTDYTLRAIDQNLGARVTLSTSTTTLYDYLNIHYDDNNWHQHVLYIKTGDTSETATLTLAFDKLVGYVFFDDVRLETSNETVFNNYTYDPATPTNKVDMSYENFDNRTFNTTKDIQTPNNWNGNEIDSLSINETGIANLNNSKFDNIPETLSGNKTALYIQSKHNVNYSYSSIRTQAFSAKTYYKISVNILTNDIIAENYDGDDKYGAKLMLTENEDIAIKGINTNGAWKTYTIYLSLQESLTSGITLGLGDDNVKTSGDVFFDNLRIEKIDESTFQNDIGNFDNDTTSCFINYTEETTTEDDDETWSNEFNWLILPSLITAVALIIAIVGFYVRKINFNRKPKIKTKYDRRKTLDKDIDRRERIALRQQIIEELNAELQSIDDEIAEFNKLAEEKLEELKNQILSEKEEIKRQKLDIEIKKKEATAEREKQLKLNPGLVQNTRAEKEFERLLAKFDKQELSLQKQLNQKDVKLETTKQTNTAKLARYLERKEFIKNEIVKIEKEIEEIAKEETEMWQEYKQAKLVEKQKKAELKESNKNSTAKRTTKTTTKAVESKKKSDVKQDNTKSNDETKEDQNTNNNDQKDNK